MALLTWNDSYSVKVDTMDEQHQKLFELINSFYDEIGKQSQAKLIFDLIAGMKAYTIEHFNKEEQLMQQCNYPGLTEHKKEHADFIDKVTDLEEKLKSGKMIISFEITNFLKDWIKKHIKESDQQYSAYIGQ
ncbi:MAG: bacteriohemerythrin [Breznakibacter sp.]